MMKIILRNITNNKEQELHLPMDDEKLEVMLDKSCEYLIVDHDPVLDVDEYESVIELNNLLQKCTEKGINADMLSVLSIALTYEEVKERIEKENYQIIKFNDYMPYGDFNVDADKGRALYEAGAYNPFPIPVPKELLDCIDWDDVWVNAECNGWTAIRYKNGCYLVNA